MVCWLLHFALIDLEIEDGFSDIWQVFKALIKRFAKHSAFQLVFTNLKSIKDCL